MQTCRGNFEWEDHIWNRYLSSWAALTQGRATIAYPMFAYRPKKNAPIGIYGQRRRAYLKGHHRVLYYNLLTAGTLDGHLADIEEQAQELFLWLVEQYADAEGVTEEVKANDPQAWVRKMNGIQHRANEAVMQEIVYG